jgi:hypothetical protein
MPRRQTMSVTSMSKAQGQQANATRLQELRMDVFVLYGVLRENLHNAAFVWWLIAGLLYQKPLSETRPKGLIDSIYPHLIA